MRINPISTTCTFRANNTKTQSSHNPTYPKPKKQLTTVEKVGIGIFSAIALGSVIAAAIIEYKKPPRKSFEKILEMNGLEFKDNILVKKENGEKFTGELKRSTGVKNPYRQKEKIETQKFVDGLITEKTYADWRGNEMDGDFYLDGKIRLHVFCAIEKDAKRFGYNDYDKDGKAYTLGDGLMDKNESVFEWAREYIKDCGWENCFKKGKSL